MQPTYTIEELRERIPELDNEGILTLQKLVKEELKRYSYVHLIEIYMLMMMRVRDIQRRLLRNGGGISDILFVDPDKFD